MKRIMSCLPVFVCFFLFIGCNSKKKKPEEGSATSSPDTTRINIPVKKPNPYVIVDVSPMDISYFPVEYPILKMEKTSSTPPLARIVYSRPHLQGRRLFQNLLKYDEPWRLGANESTELELYADAEIQGKKIKAGRYVLYCIPQKDNWTIVLNTNIDSWGLHPDPSKDLARFIIPVKQTADRLEYYTMLFQKTESGADIIMAWDDLEARLPVRFN
ncbi:MAG: DUF2911 domain-containing protein [Chitinophagaceae bacterium]|nr:DUF2911 domain-containing protein [Chitinophagaceae bacterium]